MNIFFVKLNNEINSLLSVKLFTKSNFIRLLFCLVLINVFFVSVSILFNYNLKDYYPIYEDDFFILSLNKGDFYNLLLQPRFVTYAFSALINSLPYKYIYLICFFLSTFYQALIFIIFSILLKLSNRQFYAFIFIGTIINCSQIEFYQIYHWLLYPSIFSSIFFWLNLIFILQAYNTKNNFTFIVYFSLSFFLFFLGLFSKEDFIIPMIIVNIFFALLIYLNRNSKIFFIKYQMFLLFLIIVIWIYYNYFYYLNPFINEGLGGDSTYKHSYNFFNIIYNYYVYLIRYVDVSFNLFLGLILLIIFRKRINHKEIILCFLSFILIFLIVSSYTLLENKFTHPYVTQYLPIVSAFLSLMLTRINFFSKINILIFFIFFSIQILFYYRSYNKIITLNYHLFVSKNFLLEIDQNLNLFKKNKIICININENISPNAIPNVAIAKPEHAKLLGKNANSLYYPDPWFRQDGTFFIKRYQLENYWYIFANDNSKFYRVKDSFHHTGTTKIKILPLESLSEYNCPKFFFNKNGKLIKVLID
jgi:hypothetical protein